MSAHGYHCVSLLKAHLFWGKVLSVCVIILFVRLSEWWRYGKKTPINWEDLICLPHMFISVLEYKYHYTILLREYVNTLVHLELHCYTIFYPKWNTSPRGYEVWSLSVPPFFYSLSFSEGVSSFCRHVKGFLL